MEENMLTKKGSTCPGDFIYDFVAKYYPLNNVKKEELFNEIKHRYSKYKSISEAVTNAGVTMRFVPQYWERSDVEQKYSFKDTVNNVGEFISDFIAKYYPLSVTKEDELWELVSKSHPGYKTSTIKTYIKDAERAMKFVQLYWKRIENQKILK